MGQDMHYEPSHKSKRENAPPVDSFTGDVQLDDWLSTLLRASKWNEWAPEELLMQLTGHLRGRALQEWDLLVDHEKTSWVDVCRRRFAADWNQATRSWPLRTSGIPPRGRQSLWLTSSAG